MNYDRIWEFFSVLKNNFSYNKQIMDILKRVSSNLSEMWKFQETRSPKTN
jgi:hypothetical protein